jgi:hypothetical protein
LSAAETSPALLREAGVRAILGPTAEDPDGPAHVLAVAAENPVFELALATSLSSRVTGLTFEGSAPTPFATNRRIGPDLKSAFGTRAGTDVPSTSNVSAQIRLASRFAGIAERLLPGVSVAPDVPPPEVEAHQRPI